MQHSKLIETISLFDQTELEAFENSLFYNDNRIGKDVKILFESIKGCFPDFNDNVSKQHIHQNIYPDKTYSDNRINKCMSALQHLIDQFVVQKFGKQIGEEEKLLAFSKFYREKSSDKFEKTIQKLDIFLQEHSKIKDKDYFFNRFLMFEEKIQHQNIVNNKKNDTSLHDLINEFDTYFLLVRIEYLIFLEMQAMVSNIDVSPSRALMDLVNPLIAKNKEKYEDISNFKLSFEILNILQNFDKVSEEDVSKFEQLITQNLKSINHELAINLNIICINFYTRKFNQGSQTALVKIHLLNVKYFEIFNQDISASMFQNMITVALKLKEYNWVKTLLSESKSRIIGSNNIDEIYNFNLINYYFHIKEYQKIDTNLYFNSNYIDIYYALAAKRLEIKYYFETNELYLCEIRLEAFKIWLHRKGKDTITKLTFDINNNFIDIMRQLLNNFGVLDNVKNEKLKTKIINNNNIAERGWLLDYFEKLT